MYENCDTGPCAAGSLAAQHRRRGPGARARPAVPSRGFAVVAARADGAPRPTVPGGRESASGVGRRRRSTVARRSSRAGSSPRRGDRWPRTVRASWARATTPVRARGARRTGPGQSRRPTGDARTPGATPSQGIASQAEAAESTSRGAPRRRRPWRQGRRSPPIRRFPAAGRRYTLQYHVGARRIF
jgi:hypothetical protein